MHGFLEAQLHCGGAKFTTARKCLVLELDMSHEISPLRAGQPGPSIFVYSSGWVLRTHSSWG